MLSLCNEINLTCYFVPPLEVLFQYEEKFNPTIVENLYFRLKVLNFFLKARYFFFNSIFSSCIS